MGSITLKNITKSFAKTEVIRPLDLQIDDGEFVVFVGPSGCGKSTLLRLIAGLEDITSGTIEINGKDATSVPPAKRGLAMVFQSYALYPHMSVRKNIAFPLKMAGMDKADSERKVTEAAKVLNLTDYLDRRPGQLSGGQRQRVAIGRAIVREPDAFLFDEPLSNLDASLRVDMRFEIARLHKTLASTMVYVTHDQVEAMTLADRIVVLKDGQIMQVGTPRDLYENPQNVFVAQFIGSPKMNMMRCGTVGDQFTLAGGGQGPLRYVEQGHAVQLGARPEHINVVLPGAGHCDGVVQVSEYLGADYFHYVDCGELGLVTVRTPGSADDLEGQNVGLQFDTNRLHFFDHTDQRV